MDRKLVAYGFIIASLLFISSILFITLANTESLEVDVRDTSLFVGEEGMKISSNAFGNNTFIPAEYTCDAGNKRPSLTISDVPENTRELAIVVDDPDAPGGVWNHWSVWGLRPRNPLELPSDELPSEAREGVTSFGDTGYGGPCPPKGTGTHRYFFKVYALAEPLALSPGADIETVRVEIGKKKIAEAELVGLYAHDL